MGLTDFGGGVIDPRLLASLGPLMGTLHGLQADTSSDAQQQALMDALAERTRAASQAAGQATDAYQAAASAPPPQQGPGDIGIPRLLGGVASVISGNPAYQQQAEGDIHEQHVNMLQARIQNLQSLRDIYEMRARQAESAGNLESAEKTRLLQRKMIDEEHQLVGLMGLEKQHMAGQTAEKVAGIRAGATTEAAKTRAGATTEAARIRANAPKAGTMGPGGYPDYFPDMLKTTRNGTTYLDMSKLPKDKNVQSLALQFAHEHGALPADTNTSDRLSSAEETYKNFDDMEKIIRRVLPEGPEGRLQSIPTNIAKAASQKDPDIAAWNNTQLAFIRNLQALAGGQGSGFRLMKAEIDMMNHNRPDIIFDDQPTALRKLEFERNFLKNKEMSLRMAGGKAIGPPPGAQQPDYEYDPATDTLKKVSR